MPILAARVRGTGRGRVTADVATSAARDYGLQAEAVARYTAAMRATGATPTEAQQLRAYTRGAILDGKPSAAEALDPLELWGEAEARARTGPRFARSARAWSQTTGPSSSRFWETAASSRCWRPSGAG